ncbi:hypothetical protein ACFLX5_05845 [Chloroflexota bacterium]
MAGKMEDYSGPFDPDLKFEDFSREFLLKLMDVWQREWLDLLGIWFAVVREKFGPDAAADCNLEALSRLNRGFYHRFPEVGNYRPTTVREAVKSFQLGLDNITGGVYQNEFDFKSDNHLIMTVYRCKSLEFYERAAPEMIKPICHVLEKAIMELQLVNLDIKVTALKLPPRKSPEEVPCRWELKLEE